MVDHHSIQTKFLNKVKDVIDLGVSAVVLLGVGSFCISIGAIMTGLAYTYESKPNFSSLVILFE